VFLADKALAEIPALDKELILVQENRVVHQCLNLAVLGILIQPRSFFFWRWGLCIVHTTSSLLALDLFRRLFHHL